MQGCLAVIVIIIIIVLFASYPIPAIVITVGLIIAGIISSQNNKEKAEEKAAIQRASSERAKQAYNDTKSRVTIPNNALNVCYKGGFPKLLEIKNYIWIENKDLCFFPTNPPDTDASSNINKIIFYRVPLDKIEYYTTRGEVVHENKITGGGGSGSSIKGAVVGGIIAGGAGAVIGSRKKTDPIKSELVTHDNRETFLNFFDDNNVKHSMFFEYKDYDVFNQIIPEKDYNIVNTIKTNTILTKVINENKSDNVADQIRELAKLKDEGILTEEEFTDKKKTLLDKIV